MQEEDTHPRVLRLEEAFRERVRKLQTESKQTQLLMRKLYALEQVVIETVG